MNDKRKYIKSLRMIAFFLNFEVVINPTRNENVTADNAIMAEFWYITALIFHWKKKKKKIPFSYRRIFKNFLSKFLTFPSPLSRHYRNLGNASSPWLARTYDDPTFRAWSAPCLWPISRHRNYSGWWIDAVPRVS